MSASGIPIIKALTLASEETGTIDFGQVISYVCIRNSGANTTYMAVGDTAPPASVGNGRVALLMNQPLVMDGVALQELSFSQASGESAVIEAIGYPVMSAR